MDKIKINENYENYDRVKDAFKEFVHALVWESMDIDEGMNEDEINTYIERYCQVMGDGIIHNINRHVEKYIKPLESRYFVHCYELNANGDVIEESVKHFDTDNLVIAMKNAAKFYRNANCPLVNIYDKETNKYIAEWD